MAREVTKKPTNYSYDIEVVEVLKAEAQRESKETGYKVAVSAIANKFMNEILKEKGLL